MGKRRRLAAWGRGGAGGARQRRPSAWGRGGAGVVTTSQDEEELQRQTHVAASSSRQPVGRRVALLHPRLLTSAPSDSSSPLTVRTALHHFICLPDDAKLRPPRVLAVCLDGCSAAGARDWLLQL